MLKASWFICCIKIVFFQFWKRPIQYPWCYLCVPFFTFKLKVSYLIWNRTLLVCYTILSFVSIGIGLMEIVTAPLFNSGDDAASFVRELREILLKMDTCDGKMAGEVFCSNNFIHWIQNFSPWLWRNCKRGLKFTPKFFSLFNIVTVQHDIFPSLFDDP